MSTSKRPFKGFWITADIVLDDSISSSQKLILAEIDSLTNEAENKPCSASNRHFSKHLGISANSISRLIGELVEKKKLQRKVVFDTDGKTIKERYLWLPGKLKHEREKIPAPKQLDITEVLKAEKHPYQELKDIYGSTKNHASAQKHWKKVGILDRKACLDKVPEYLKYLKRTGISKVYISRFISERRWEDDYSPANDSGIGPVGVNPTEAVIDYDEFN